MVNRIAAALQRVTWSIDHFPGCAAGHMCNCGRATRVAQAQAELVYKTVQQAWHLGVSTKHYGEATVAAYNADMVSAVGFMERFLLEQK